MAEQSLRLDGRKVCIIKRVGISQAESNKATVCALPSIHLPLTRDGHGCPKLNARSFAGRKTNRAFIWQVCWQFSRDSAVLGGLVWVEGN